MLHLLLSLLFLIVILSILRIDLVNIISIGLLLFLILGAGVSLEIDGYKIIYILILLFLVFGVTSTPEPFKNPQPVKENNKTRQPVKANNKNQQPIKTIDKNYDRLIGFRSLIKAFDCSQSEELKNVLDKTDDFSLSIILNVANYKPDSNWYRIFSIGNRANGRKSFGLWVHKGFLYVMVPSKICTKIDTLGRDSHYHLILVHKQNTMNVYLDGQKIGHCATIRLIKKNNIKPNINIGPDHGVGAPIYLTLTYLPQAIEDDEVTSAWSFLKDIIKNPKSMKRIENKGVTIYEDPNFGGKSRFLPIGKYNIKRSANFNYSMSSLLVPQGYLIRLFEKPGFKGRSKTFKSNQWFTGDFNNNTSSIIVEYKPLPKKMTVKRMSGLKEGDVISLQSFNTKFMVEKDDKKYNIKADKSRVGQRAKWIVNKLGSNRVALESWRNRYITLEPNGAINASRLTIGPWEKWTVTYHDDNQISLKSWNNKYLTTDLNGNIKVTSNEDNFKTRWKIDYVEDETVSN